ncbi:hypothetical protein QJS10_CPA07g00727 [Acorus calamus]|uniref:Reverse transcriptase n=1 Tax=Acorus calamus TaxID=4465 RepID=A0AAV9EIW2_ACOCL|nr:hypothetical protein QJS10_CPA07g00727 [Acorus calamus]
MSGLRINYSKSVIIPINVEDGMVNQVADIIGCSVGNLPCRHLGLPLVKGRLKKEDWIALVERMKNRLAGWKRKNLSYGGRVTLLQAVMTSMPWLWRWGNSSGNAAWKRLLSERYRANHRRCALFPRPSRRMTHIVKGMFDQAAEFGGALAWEVGDGQSTRFWEDVWCGSSSLRECFPLGFQEAARKGGNVASYMAASGQWEVLATTPGSTEGSGIQAGFNTVREMWEAGCSMARNTPGGTSGSPKAVVALVVPAVACVIWRTRNAVLFKGQRAYVENAVEETGRLIKEWGCSLAGAAEVELRSGRSHNGT